MADPVTVALTTPIPGDAAFGQPILIITLRPPTGRDLRKCGVPVTVSDAGVGDINAEAIARYIAELGGLPPAAVDAMTAVDWQACMVAVLGFFAPPAAG